jgi:uncharacterized protein
MKKIMLLMSFPMLLNSFIFSQNNDKSFEKPYIDVVGSHEKEVIPDEIYIFIRLQERKQGKTVPIQETELKTRLTKLGISLENLAVKNYAGDYRTYKAFKKDLLTTKEFTLKLQNVNQLDSVFQQLDILDEEDARIERLSHSKMPEFRREVKINAMKAAKNKADYLLEAIGEKTGKPIYIIENDYENSGNLQSQSRSNSNSYAPLSGRNGVDLEDRGSLEFQRIKIRFTISARFAIQ